ncbi:helix-turn-helix domain-containing protein [Rheinheimera sp.]|uniref:helix-turn-helix transcriptional regulator n=1 Tax=Rheinheimera sp. TaxID=1869214 RepID=UPI00307CEE00
MSKDTNYPKDQSRQGYDLEKLLYMNYLVHKSVLTMDECADYTGLSKHYLYKLTHNRLIPHFKPNGKKVYFQREELDAWLSSNRVCTQREEGQLATTLANRLNRAK